MTIDPAGQTVITFSSALLNASRVGTYADLVVNMFTSQQWRRYETALGVTTWRAHEFDYFLIACDARYEDLFRILLWDTVRAAKMADAMSGDPSPNRRPLAEASAAWQSGTPQTLIDRAKANGWISAREKAPTLKAPPVSRRALVRGRQGITMDEQARRGRQRRLSNRRAALNQLVEQIMTRAEDPEAVRYIIDQLRRRLPRRGRPSGSSQHAIWRRDIAAVNGNPAKLATRWRVSSKTAQKRIERMSDK
jgi:hypothetical protein